MSIGQTLRQTFFVLLAILSLVPIGCASYIANQIINPPNRDGPLSEQFISQEQWDDFISPALFSEVWEMPGDSGQPKIRAMLLPAGTYTHSWESNLDDDARKETRFKAQLLLEPGVGRPVKGTAILLHGWLGDSTQLLYHALALAEYGYDCLLVDLRGHGRSGGDHVTFGIHESEDILRLIEHVQTEAELTPPFWLFGTSLGAAVAVMSAARDDRFEAVVAVAAYAELQSALPTAIKGIAPWYFRPFLGKRRVEKAMALAEERAGFDFSDAAPIQSVAGIQSPVLLLYGETDRIIPPSEGLRLHEEACCSTFIEVPDRGHVPLVVDRDTTLEHVLPWLETNLHEQDVGGGNACRCE